MEAKINQATATALTIAQLAAISEKLNIIDEKVTREKPILSVGDALRLFRAHIELNHKQPRNFRHMLDEFEMEFLDCNIPDINSYEPESFLKTRWGQGAKSAFNTRIAQLNLLFNFCIKEVRKKGGPKFHNPVDLVDKAKHVPLKENKYIGIEKAKEFLYQADDD